jgi:hypothetical protein
VRRSPNATHSISSSTKKKQGMQGRRLKWAGPIIYCGKYLLMQTNLRTISSSWALFSSASMAEVLSAGFCRCQNSFIDLYMQSMTSHADNHSHVEMDFDDKSEIPVFKGKNSLELELDLLCLVFFNIFNILIEHSR